MVDPRWPLHDLSTQQCTTLWSGVLITIFGSHRAFLKQIDLWMTFDPRSGRFENKPTNLVGLSPTPMPTFSLIPQSMVKRIAGHTYTHTHIHTRLHYSSNIDVMFPSQVLKPFMDIKMDIFMKKESFPSKKKNKLRDKKLPRPPP